MTPPQKKKAKLIKLFSKAKIWLSPIFLILPFFVGAILSHVFISVFEIIININKIF
jgi:uncharacterized membrane protein YoaK (UPF0700 family)